MGEGVSIYLSKAVSIYLSAIEQAKAADRSTIRCHISHIAQHSDTELAIRKSAIRIMPQGGECSYAELVRNTHHLYQTLLDTSDDLVLFSHGGDRRGVSFTSSQENNVKTVLAHRLGKSQTTINKYLQHGDNLNDSALESLVDSGATKLFFEAFQVKKQIEIAAMKAEQKDEAAIVAAISNKVSAWLDEFQRASMTRNPSIGDPQRTRADRSSDTEASSSSEVQRITPIQRIPRGNSGTADVAPAIEPSPADVEDAATELKRIGEALIEIANNQSPHIDRYAHALKDLITRLCQLLSQILHAEAQENKGKEGQV